MDGLVVRLSGCWHARQPRSRLAAEPARSRGANRARRGADLRQSGPYTGVAGSAWSRWRRRTSRSPPPATGRSEGPSAPVSGPARSHGRAPIGRNCGTVRSRGHDRRLLCGDCRRGEPWRSDVDRSGRPTGEEPALFVRRMLRQVLTRCHTPVATARQPRYQELESRKAHLLPGFASPSHARRIHG